jgi:amidase
VRRLAAELAELDAGAQAALVHAGEVRPRELVEAAIERVEALDDVLNSVVVHRFEQALVEADRTPTDAAFAGVPYLLKDLVVEIEDEPFQEGSRYLAGYRSPYTSELVHRLRRAGLVVIGRTNAPEFGMVPACEPQLYGPTRNPWAPDRSTSGSSGGAAAAVAARLVPMAHGNDLGGSLRYPASACGVFGLKPTRARNPLGPLYGDAVNGWAAEHAVTWSVRDSAALLDATAGPALGDPYPAPPVNGPLVTEVDREPGRLRIAWTARTAGGDLGHPDCVAALEDAVELLSSLGHELVETPLPALGPADGHAIGTVFDAATAWIVEHWTRRLGRAPEDHEIEPLTRAYWERGRVVSAAEYLCAIEQLQRYARKVASFLTEHDAFLTPTMSTPPLPLGEITSTVDDPLRAARTGGQTVGYAQVVANMTGNPAMSVPLWWNADGLPIGVHVLGGFGDEAMLLRLAGQLERARPWAQRLPLLCAAGSVVA